MERDGSRQSKTGRGETVTRASAAPAEREVMTLAEAAAYLGVSLDTMYKYAADGAAPAFKLGNRWRFKRSRLDEWMETLIDNHENAPPTD